MILANGKVYPPQEQNRLLAKLGERINQTRAAHSLTCNQVIHALDQMGKRLAAGEFSREIDDPFLQNHIRYAAEMLSEDALRRKVETELGEHWEQPRRIGELTAQTVPLGVLLHIAAGNMDALPAWSVIEGLLACNINILKLPQADKGLTVRFFEALTRQSPELRDHIYIFDTPSTDVAGMQKLAAQSDGIAVWGGDAAVAAVRRLAPIGAKLIEWGHRLGFCYIAGSPAKAELQALAGHILESRQLLCSSCQVIYLDTDDFGEIRRFSEQFLPYLEAAAQKFPITEIGAAAELTLRRYTGELEAILGGSPSADRVYQGKQTSATACADSALTISCLYGNVLVKALPREQLLPVLRTAKDYLQTAGLICPPEEREALTALLVRAGVNRVLPPGRMSETFPCEAHDGEYALRRYTRIVNML